MNRKHQIWTGLIVAIILVVILLPTQFPGTPGLPKITWIDHVSEHVSNATHHLGEKVAGQASTVTVTATATVTQEVSIATAISKPTQQSPTGNRPPPPEGYPGPREVKVALLETNGWHDEVVAALMHSLGSQPQVDLRIFYQRFRYGSEEVFSKFKLARKMPAYEKWQTFMDEEQYVPDIMVMTTCELDFPHLAPRLQKLIKEKKTYIFCIIHNSDVWFEPDASLDIVKPWAQEGLIDFIVLSEAVIKTVEDKGMRKWPREGEGNITRTIRYFAPIFPAHLPTMSVAVNETTTFNATKDKDDRGGDTFAMQGIFNADRRNYDEVFKNLQQFIDDRAKMSKEENSKWWPKVGNPGKATKPKDRDIQLQILGHLEGAPPAIPDALKNNVHFHDSLPYTEFYNILSQQCAILPAFADDKYLWRKASSSIAASFISGAPIIADEAILKAYSYIGEDAVYLQGSNETDFDVLRRVLAGPVEWRAEKMRRVRERAAEVVQENKSKVKAWITEAGAHIGFFR